MTTNPGLPYIEKHLLLKIRWNNQFVLLRVVGIIIFALRAFAITKSLMRSSNSIIYFVKFPSIHNVTLIISVPNCWHLFQVSTIRKPCKYFLTKKNHLIWYNREFFFGTKSKKWRSTLLRKTWRLRAIPTSA